MIQIQQACGPADYHFIRLTEDGWYNKSGKIYQVLYVDQSIVSGNMWYEMCESNGKVYIGDPRYGYLYYDDETIYFAIKKGWDAQ